MIKKLLLTIVVLVAFTSCWNPAEGDPSTGKTFEDNPHCREVTLDGMYCIQCQGYFSCDFEGYCG